jgi:hypothetical protein
VSIGHEVTTPPPPPLLSRTISRTTMSPAPPPLTRLHPRLFERARRGVLAPEPDGDWDGLAEGLTGGGVPTMIDMALMPNDST